MVETTINLRPYIDVPTLLNPSSNVKLPLIACSGKIIAIHSNNRISITYQEKKHWKKGNESLCIFLDHHFTNIEKIEILKKIYRGMHTSERVHALRYLKYLKKK